MLALFSDPQNSTFTCKLSQKDSKFSPHFWFSTVQIRVWASRWEKLLHFSWLVRALTKWNFADKKKVSGS
jgi:hypothetical protein